MGRPRRQLPAGIDQLADVMGAAAALELVLWRWCRCCERSPAPWRVSIYVPSTLPDSRDHWLNTLRQEHAAALVQALGGEQMLCRVPAWLLEHYLIAAGLRDMSAGSSAAWVANRYGKDPTAWRKLYNEPPRDSPLDRVHENIAAEVVHLLLQRRRAQTRNSGTDAR